MNTTTNHDEQAMILAAAGITINDTVEPVPSTSMVIENTSTGPVADFNPPPPVIVGP